MTPVSIRLITQEDAQAILDFELKNRRFFESIIPARPDTYYTLENLQRILAEIEEEQANDQCYMYIIQNTAGEMVGRVNLVDIQRGPLEKAEIGFRLGEAFNGKGYATAAVNLALIDAFHKYKLHRIEAGTSPHNIGSQIVLIKNGFQFVGRSKGYIKLHGKWEDSLHFEKLNDQESE